MTIKILMAALIGGTALWQLAGKYQLRQQQKRLAQTPVKPEAVTTWEGEGGALRGSGAQLGPAPEMP